ncbi:IclR family transcriptional regulator [Mycobacterium yunnanensis]|uniref:IclR family transcriptional regulator n=1 Tax=Mycobacterium yunnanensis TaxID=368477 RepID=A0A9X2Z0E2_9MYCO|nr:IclR family transcriptional regulator [Mycobacterium yunnanensis]MCV7419987.1 IclR family transcriptional regulator [Mycobacterium yunnanensis]
MATTALRGLHLLEMLAGMKQPATLRDIATRAGLSESYAFRLLSALEADGFLHHLGRSGYRLGSRSIALATVIGPRPAMMRLMYPVLARLVADGGEAAVVHLRAGDFRVLVLGVPSPTGPVVDPAGMLGERSPLTAGASGRVILAHLSEAERAGFTGVDPDAMTVIREQGYEMSFGENHVGVNGISVPMQADLDDPAAPGAVLGALTVAGPASRMTPEAMSRLLGPLRRASRDLSPRLAALLGPNPGATVGALDL